MKNNILFSIIGILLVIIIILLLRFWTKFQSLSNNYDIKITELKKSIIESDKLTKEAEGRYAKLVDYYATRMDLSKELKKIDKDLFNIVKNQDERLLSITNAVLSFESKLDSGFGKFNISDTNLIDIELSYPSKDSSFVLWNGYVNKQTAKYRGDWKFNGLPISIIATEEKRGLWKHRIVGPDWIKIDSLTIKSLPPEEYIQTVDKKLQFLVGINYSTDLMKITSIGNVGLGIGINYDRTHNLLLNINTANQIGIGYYYQFRTYKNKK